MGQLSNILDEKIGGLSLGDPKTTSATTLTMKQAEKLGSNERLQALIDRQMNNLQAAPEVVTWLETSIVPTVSSCPDLLQKADRFKLATLKESCEKMMANQFFFEVKLACDSDHFSLTLSDAFVNDKQRKYRDIALQQLCRALENKPKVGIVITKNLDDAGLVRLFEILSPLLPRITSLKMQNFGLATFSFDALLPYLKSCQQLTELSLQNYPQFDIDQLVCQLCSMSHLQDLDIRGVSVTLSSLRRLVYLNTVQVSSSSEIPEVVVKHFSVPVLSQAHVEIDLGESEVSEEVLGLLFMRFPRFNGIALKGCASVEALNRVLAVVPDRMKITQFQLCRYSVDPFAALASIDEALPQITNLRIRGRISGSLMSFVLNRFKNLRDFAVGAFSNGDECVQDPITDNIFTEIHERHPKLSCLALARLSQITPMGLEQFVSSQEALQNVRMAFCPKISDEDLQRLQGIISARAISSR